ncbi:MAG: transporter associated domain-containing protein, partial [Mycetocola sp.]
GSSDTIAGFITEHLGRLAVVGDAVDVPGATIQVTALDRRRVAGVRITPLVARGDGLGDQQTASKDAASLH